MEEACKEANATNLFNEILKIMSSPGQKQNDLYEKNAHKVVNVIYMLIYGQSQSVHGSSMLTLIS